MSTNRETKRKRSSSSWLAYVFQQPAMTPIRDAIVKWLPWTGHVSLRLAIPDAIGLDEAPSDVTAVRWLMACGASLADLEATWMPISPDHRGCLVRTWAHGDLLNLYAGPKHCRQRNFAGTFQFAADRLVSYTRNFEFTRLDALNTYANAWYIVIQQSIGHGCGWPELRTFAMRIKRTLVGADWYQNKLHDYVFFWTALEQGNFRLAHDIFTTADPGIRFYHFSDENRIWLVMLKIKLYTDGNAADIIAGMQLMGTLIGPCPWTAYCDFIVTLHLAMSDSPHAYDNEACIKSICAFVDDEATRHINKTPYWSVMYTWLSRGLANYDTLHGKIQFLHLYFPGMVRTMIACPAFTQWTRECWAGTHVNELRTFLGIS